MDRAQQWELAVLIIFELPRRMRQSSHSTQFPLTIHLESDECQKLARQIRSTDRPVAQLGCPTSASEQVVQLVSCVNAYS